MSSTTVLADYAGSLCRGSGRSWHIASRSRKSASSCRSAQLSGGLLPCIDRRGRLPMDLKLLSAQVLPVGWQQARAPLPALRDEKQRDIFGSNPSQGALRILQDGATEAVVEQARGHALRTSFGHGPFPRSGAPAPLGYGACRDASKSDRPTYSLSASCRASTSGATARSALSLTHRSVPSAATKKR